MNAYSTRVARTSSGQNNLNTLVPLGPCFVRVKVFDDALETSIASAPYTLRGMLRGKTYSGRTDADGIVHHEGIPDDHYELEVNGKRELVEVWYMAELDLHDGKPWFLRMRDEG